MVFADAQSTEIDGNALKYCLSLIGHVES